MKNVVASQLQVNLAGGALDSPNFLFRGNARESITLLEFTVG